MNVNGIIRRVDELGRIVIPVEIRRLIGIRVGENLDFNVINNEIILKKTSCVSSNNKYFLELFNNLSEFIEGNILITDREKIVHSTDNNLCNLFLDKEITDLLVQHEECYTINDNIRFSNTVINSPIYVYPYYQESDIAGFIIIYNVSNEKDYRKLIKYVCKELHNHLSV